MIISTQDMVDYTSDTAQAEQFLLDVTQATELKLDIDEVIIPKPFFNRFKQSLSHATHLKSVIIHIRSGDDEEHTIDDGIIHEYFQALTCIPHALDAFNLELETEAYDQVVFSNLENLLSLHICQTLREAPAFQNLTELTLKDSASDEGFEHNHWANFFVNLLQSIPNKSTLNKLDLHFKCVQFSQEIEPLLLNEIWQCTGLTTFCIWERYLTGHAWSSFPQFQESCRL